MRKKILGLILIGGITTASCSSIGGLFAPTATHTPTLTNTPTLSSTPTPTPTPTKTPTPSPTPIPELEFGEPVTVDGGIFSYSPVTGFGTHEGLGEVEFATRDQRFKVIFLGGFNTEDVSSKAMIEEMANILSEQMDNFISEGPYTYVVDGRQGHSIDFSGEVEGVSYTGQSVAVAYGDKQYFISQALSSNDDGESSGYWATQGKAMVEGVLDHVVLHEVSPDEGKQGCVVSEDPTYGYSKDNPIKVGGGAFGGPSRERAYLDNLLGPNGETVTYIRSGSFPHGETILDTYTVTAAGRQSVELYLDEYSYETLLAPVGFTCRGEFALGEP